MEDNEKYVWFSVCFVVLALGILWISLGYNYHTDRLYIKNGYTRKTLPGANTPQWVKE